MPFSTGHTPPRGASEEVLDLGVVEVGVLMFEDLEGILEEETEILV